MIYVFTPSWRERARGYYTGCLYAAVSPYSYRGKLPDYSTGACSRRVTGESWPARRQILLPASPKHFVFWILPAISYSHILVIPLNQLSTKCRYAISLCSYVGIMPTYDFFCAMRRAMRPGITHPVPPVTPGVQSTGQWLTTEFSVFRRFLNSRFRTSYISVHMSQSPSLSNYISPDTGSRPDKYVDKEIACFRLITTLLEAHQACIYRSSLFWGAQCFAVTIRQQWSQTQIVR